MANKLGRPRLLRVYVDTSVFGGTFDALFLAESQRFFALARAGQFQIVTSIHSPMEVLTYEEEENN